MRTFLLIAAVIFGFYYVFLFDTIPSDFKMVFKLIPMVLIIIFALLTRHAERKYYTLIGIGLIFCAIGDYTLQWFIVGLISFLIGHIFYITAFSSGKKRVPTAVKTGLLLYGAAMAIWMCSTLFQKGEIVLTMAVFAYISVILTMGWTSFRTGSTFAIIGALLFIASDSILAINKFIVAVPFSHELIMFTYYGAQIFIASSIAQYYENRNKVIH
ncbi:lysoplasmalogenase [Lysinibacillus sp. KU-BSD001]|uniref:lysoplasmalogenase n=1 Tax=Lysinibacillus sp. KU-BSD001 TaxID=3141328 RepID=UPI0036ED4483